MNATFSGRRGLFDTTEPADTRLPPFQQSWRSLHLFFECVAKKKILMMSPTPLFPEVMAEPKFLNFSSWWARTGCSLQHVLLVFASSREELIYFHGAHADTKNGLSKRRETEYYDSFWLQLLAKRFASEGFQTLTAVTGTIRPHITSPLPTGRVAMLDTVFV